MLFLSGIPGHSLQEVALIALLVNFDAFRAYLRLERVVLHALEEEHRSTVPSVPVRNGAFHLSLRACLDYAFVR